MRPSAAATPQDGRNPRQEHLQREKAAKPGKMTAQGTSPEIPTRLCFRQDVFTQPGSIAALGGRSLILPLLGQEQTFKAEPLISSESISYG
jgi:hypothetical protein